ncbi:MAG: hypothetical protein A2Z03_04110 [Chloroflexi bacterium RBG_16_56_8]|nr:MAG: hypothetical protein A2Z03_04110 [Chloroflexi bacterium RBG_16_56_8]
MLKEEARDTILADFILGDPDDDAPVIIQVDSIEVVGCGCGAGGGAGTVPVRWGNTCRRWASATHGVPRLLFVLGAALDSLPEVARCQKAVMKKHEKLE